MQINNLRHEESKEELKSLLMKVKEESEKAGLKFNRICCMAQEAQTGALYKPRGVGWGERWVGGSKGREYMYSYG